MAAEAFKIKGTIGLDGVQNTKKEIADVTNTAEKSSSKIGSVFSKIGKGIGTAAKVIGTGVGVAAGALGGLTVKSVQMAGDLEQNMGGSEAVFGKYAGKMQNTAKKAFSSMGLSTSDYLATANKMGALFQGAGFDVEKSMTMSQDAMQRAADVASIMGIDTSAAMEAVAGAAKGNFTMMDNLGVAMNETTLANYALEKGMKKSYDQMTQQEKIGVAMEMFMDKTAYAAGNYAKENETLAGSLGTAKAAFDNFLSGAGTVDDVVSSFTNAAEVIVKNVTELAPKLMTGITQIVNKLVPQIPPLLKQLLPPLIEGAVSLINGIVSAMPQIISALMAAIPALIDGLVSITVALCENFADITQPIIDYLPEIIITIVNALLENLPALVEAGGQLLMGLLEGMVSLIKKIPSVLKSIWNAIVNGIKSLFEIHSPSKVMMDIGKNIMQGLINGIKNLVGKCGEVMKSVWNGIKNIFSNVGSWFKNQFEQGKKNAQQAWSGVTNFFSNIWSGIKKAFSNVGSWFKNIFSSAKNGITNAWSGVKNFFSNIKNGITNTFANIKEKLSGPFEKARDAIKKVVDKIKGFFSNMKLNLPKIKLPHFKIDGKLSLNPPSVPKLKIDWYKKGGILTEPTIFDYNPMSNTAKVGGEAGAEAIAPIETLTGYVQEAVRAETSGLSYHIERLYNIISHYLPLLLEGIGKQIVLDDGTLVGKLAPKLDRKLGAIYDRRARY